MVSTSLDLFIYPDFVPVLFELDARGHVNNFQNVFISFVSLNGDKAFYIL